KISRIEAITQGIAFMFLGTIFLAGGFCAYQFFELPLWIPAVSGGFGALLLLSGFKQVVF
ncbi:MAG: hypothetical protein SFU25_09995, partial [Candidatus Caenarcaniphilales bacterium]|nr:hypothetical protein [Candidatus Caenarcaniphilales bacterium]